jgi:oxalate decarboxylase
MGFKMSSQYFFSLKSTKPHLTQEGGSLTYVTSKEMPGLVGMSFAHLKLKKRGALEPIWHPNAHKMGYCLGGNVLVSIRTPEGIEVFTVQKGEMFFIPQGYVHHIENLDNKDSSINFALNCTNPEVMFLSKAVYSISDNVFNSTFNTTSRFVHGLKRSINHELLTTLPKIKDAPDYIASRYKFDIKDSSKAILTKGGYLQVGTKTNLPVLNGLGLLNFGLNPHGSVEPHWHTNAGELVYIVKGKTRITLLSPSGKVDVLTVSGGEGAFAPASHFHNIENIGAEDVEVTAFFNHAEPDYIGIGEVVGSCSNDVLASIFNVAPDYFDILKKPEEPLVIVPV